MRSDEQLVALFRSGHDEAFRVIHDRYRNRLFAYARQMLPHLQDAEDALQDVFVRAYSGLRANDRDLSLRAWLYRVAHNRCIDELRRPSPPPPEVLELLRAPAHDPIAQADQRESLRRLVADVRRLSEQQRSALLMRELGGMSYVDIAAALGLSVPAVKSLLVRARVTLAKASEARETACSEIREALMLAHDRGVRPGAMARRHMRDCAGCRQYRRELRGVSKQFAALVPTLGPIGALANALGIGGGAAAGGGALAAGGVAGTASLGAVTVGAGHVATLIAAAVVTAGGAVEIQRTIAVPAHHRHRAAPIHARTPRHSAGRAGRHSTTFPRHAISRPPRLASRAGDASPAPPLAPITSNVTTASPVSAPAGALRSKPPGKRSSLAAGSATTDPAADATAGATGAADTSTGSTGATGSDSPTGGPAAGTAGTGTSSTTSGASVGSGATSPTPSGAGSGTTSAGALGAAATSTTTA